MADDAGTNIGSTIIITGELQSKEDITIEGTIRGHIQTEADLFVDPEGTIEASVATRNIDVRGTVRGNVAAADRFEIHEGGSVEGDVQAPRVVLADGSKYRGNIDMDVKGRRPELGS
jgi:cytoskeletal protein CcmA (bactofilin family)